MKNIRIISASTKKGFSSGVYDLPLITESTGKLNLHHHIEFNNTQPLAQVYNKYINNNPKDYLIFCHDDCIIEDLFFVEKVRSALEIYDIVGLAGMKAPIAIKPPCLWHLMGNPQNASGAVAHFAKDIQTRWMTNYGPSPQRVILLDGVFLAINTERILEKGLCFDENNPAGFHFYDLDFSLTANKLGLKLGTCPIWCTHKSHGLETPTKDWLKGQDWFLKKWG